MGIPKFYNNIIKQLFADKQKVTTLPGGRAGTVYIDNNAAIHAAAGPAYSGRDEYQAKIISTKSEEEKAIAMHENYLNLINRIVNTLRPHTLVIASDGIVPASKVHQQRERRYRSVLLRDPNTFDSNAITVGTPFMNAFDLWLRDKLKPGNAQLDLEQVIYINHRVAGEGEHVILDLVRSGRIKDDGRPHVIYGLDADLFELGALMPVDDVYLARETLESFQSIKILMTMFEQIYNVTRDDFVVLLKYLGNDHLPRLPSFTGSMLYPFRRALELHRDSKEHLTIPAVSTLSGTVSTTTEEKMPSTAREINWIAWHNLTTRLARDEAKFLAEPSVREEDIILDADSFDSQYNRWYARALRAKTPVPSKLMAIPEIAALFGVSRARIEDMVQHYKRMLAWCCRYYFGQYTKTGETVAASLQNEETSEGKVGTVSYPVMARWDVYYPYEFAPLLTDLAVSKYVPSLPSYARFGDFSRWEVEQVLHSARLRTKKSDLTDYELKQINEWLNSTTGVTVADDPEKQEWFTINGDTPRRIFNDRIVPRRLITQLFLVIPPASIDVLDKEQKALSESASLLAYVRPQEYALEAGDLKEIPTSLPTIQKVHEFKQALTQKERIVYLPDIDYINVYKYFLRADVARLPRTDVMLEYHYTRAERYYSSKSRGTYIRPTPTPSSRPSTLKINYGLKRAMHKYTS